MISLFGILGIISGEAVLTILIYLICIALCFWLIWWLINYCALPEPFNKIIRVIMAIAAVIVLIKVLMSLAGHSLIAW